MGSISKNNPSATVAATTVVNTVYPSTRRPIRLTSDKSRIPDSVAVTAKKMIGKLMSLSSRKNSVETKSAEASSHGRWT